LSASDAGSGMTTALSSFVVPEVFVATGLALTRICALNVVERRSLADASADPLS
jgi:hypothetical protein